MNKNYIELTLGDGQSFFVDLSQEKGQPDRVKEDNPALYSRMREFGEAVSVIRPIVDKVLKPLTTLENKPKQVEIQFGFSLGARNEVILNQEGKEAHIKVKILFEP